MTGICDQVKDIQVNFRTHQGVEARANLLKLTRHSAVIEILDLELDLRTSEALDGVKMCSGQQLVYSGRAVVHEVVITGTAMVGNLALEEKGFDQAFFSGRLDLSLVEAQFRSFLDEWQKNCEVRAEFKVSVANIETFLVDLRHWLEQVEVGLNALPVVERESLQRSIIDSVSPSAVKALDALFETFESLYLQMTPEEQPTHRAYVQRRLLPIVLVAPFAGRSYRKPLGYAGDYEMVNMIFRDPQEGSSVFARLFNVWLLHQGSAKAHRSRVQILQEKLVTETARVVRSGRRARILNLGCGPAREIQGFLEQSQLSDHAEFVLMDFDEETLRHAREALESRRGDFGRRTKIDFVRESVQQLLKKALRAKEKAAGSSFDYIYCAGLFDYLPDWTCAQLVNLFYQSLNSGGSLLVTNVTPHSPNRGSLELILDWNLIYRSASQIARFRPSTAPADAGRIYNDETGFNVFLEVNRPDER